MLDRWRLWPIEIRVLAVSLAVLLVAALAAGGVFVARSQGASHQVAAVASSARTSGPAPTAAGQPLVVRSPTAAPPLTCRIPVAGNQPGSGGFVTLPGGEFAGDPSSNVHLPGLSYAPGFTYAHTLARWLPVPIAWESPDGLRYMYIDQRDQLGRGGAIHVVTIQSGADQTLGYGTPASAARVNEGWSPVDYQPEGIYVMSGPQFGAPVNGLWLADPTGGGFRQVTSSGFWQHAGGGLVWGVDSAQVGPGPGAGNVVRVDPKTGAVDGWFSRPGLGVNVVGLDGSRRPIVSASSDVVQEIWILTSQGKGDRIYSGPGYNSAESLRIVGAAFADGHGLWFGTSNGLFLYAGGQMKKLSSASGQVAGRCV